MDRETARQEIRSRIPCTDFLEKSKSGSYCCPFCHSGEGQNHTGALKVYSTNTWTCFSCNRTGDVIDLFEKLNGVDYNDALALMAQQCGLDLEAYRPAGTPRIDRIECPQRHEQGQESINIHQAAEMQQRGTQEQESLQPAPVDYTNYYLTCIERLNDPAAIQYLQGRGISPATAAAYWIGYDPAADPVNAPGADDAAYKPHPCPRIIIPTTTAHYVGRRTDGIKDFAKMGPRGSHPAIFNQDALFSADTHEVFIVEGAFDALSVIEAGAAAVALGSTCFVNKLIALLESRRTAATLILCLDNDKAGQDATEKLKAGLQRLNVSFITADICSGHKDPNEALTADRRRFCEAIEKARRKAAAKPDSTDYYINAVMAGEIARFKNDKKTGFWNLDAQAGGLYAGLYAIAAISSLGKTSFALQLADQLAESGNDVIFFSLEQSKLELVSKSLARTIAKSDPSTMCTSLAIRKGNYTEKVAEAAAQYRAAVGDRISIVEGNFNCTLPFIGDYIRRYVNRNGTQPVIIIDYLQILQPAADTMRMTAREVIDNAVTELKRISRELDLTIIVISSVNRANYLTPIDFESLKESGGIEFTCDVIWGLQLQCLNDKIFDKQNNIKERRDRIREAKAALPRKIELSCLKNRYGIANYSCYFNYYPDHDLFTECHTDELDFDIEARTQRAGRRI